MASQSDSRCPVIGMRGAPNRRAPSTGLSAAGACVVLLLWFMAALAHPGVSEDIKSCANPHASSEAQGDSIRGKNVILEQLLSLNSDLQMEF